MTCKVKRCFLCNAPTTETRKFPARSSPAIQMEWLLRQNRDDEGTMALLNRHRSIKDPRWCMRHFAWAHDRLPIDLRLVRVRPLPGARMLTTVPLRTCRPVASPSQPTPRWSMMVEPKKESSDFVLDPLPRPSVNIEESTSGATGMVEPKEEPLDSLEDSFADSVVKTEVPEEPYFTQQGTASGNAEFKKDEPLDQAYPNFQAGCSSIKDEELEYDVTDSSPSLSSIYANHPGPKDFSLKCPQCCRRFNTKTLFENHFRLLHSFKRPVKRTIVK